MTMANITKSMKMFNFLFSNIVNSRKKQHLAENALFSRIQRYISPRWFYFWCCIHSDERCFILTPIRKEPRWAIYFLETILAIYWIIKKQIAPSIYRSLVNISVRRLLSKWDCHENGLLTECQKNVVKNTSIRDMHVCAQVQVCVLKFWSNAHLGKTWCTLCVSMCVLFVFPFIDSTIIATEHLWTSACTLRGCPHLHFSSDNEWNHFPSRRPLHHYWHTIIDQDLGW